MKAIYPYYEVEPITTLKDMLTKSSRRFSKKIVLQWKADGQWRSLTYEEFSRNVEALGTALIDLGVGPQDKVALLGENRPEWAVAYLATACARGVCVPIDKELRQQEIFHILYLSETAYIVASEKYIEDLLEMKPRLPSLKGIISMDDVQVSGVDSFQKLLEEGKRKIKKGRRVFAERAVEPDDLAAIIFTSGTMGNPKGVMLSHQNITANMMDMCRSVYIDDHDRFLSVLPLHHTYECTCGFLAPIYRGSTIAYAENLRRIPENLAETKTTVMLGVPLLYEAMYKRIKQGIEEKGKLKFTLAKGVARVSEKLLGRGVRRRIFSQLHKRFGGRLRLLICGGAPLDPEVAGGFRELGIHFLQGYGLTEGSPLVAVNRPEAFKDEAAGLPLYSTEIKIVDDEICVRGDNIMRGYYRNPQATAEVIHDGWLHTGDLGYFDQKGFLHIHGRKKSVIVLPGGKNVYPEEVEAELLKSPFILECLVWGGPDPKNAEMQAMIVPNIEQLDLHYGQPAEMLTQPAIEQIIRNEINHCCARLAPYKRVKKFTLREEEFAKTTTRKVKRYLYTQTAKPLEAKGP